MITLESNMTLKDIRQWLSYGWFLYRGVNYKGLVPAQICGYPNHIPMDEPVVPPDTQFYIRTINNTQEKRRYDELPDCIFPHWPLLGAVNIPEYKIAVRCSRRQYKQWCRTFLPELATWNIPKLKTLQRRYPSLKAPLLTDNHSIAALFAPEYPTSAELMQRFALNWRSVALTPQIIVTNTSPMWVYFRDEVAATIQDGHIHPLNARLARRVEKVISDGDLIT